MTEFKYAYPPQPIATAPKFFKSDSIACPDGELGFTQAANTEEITEDEFLAAAERHWK